MSYSSAIKKLKTQEFQTKTKEFPVKKDILFPKICIICGDNTEEKYKKIIKGAFFAKRDYNEEYILNLPVCNICHKAIDMKTGISSKAGKLTVISTIFGLIFAILLYMLTFSIFLSIALFFLALIIPFIKYRSITVKKVRLSDHIRIKLGKDKETLGFDFLNKNYSSYIDEINSKEQEPEKPPEKEK